MVVFLSRMIWTRGAGEAGGGGWRRRSPQSGCGRRGDEPGRRWRAGTGGGGAGQGTTPARSGSTREEIKKKPHSGDEASVFPWGTSPTGSTPEQDGATVGRAGGSPSTRGRGCPVGRREEASGHLSRAARARYHKWGGGLGQQGLTVSYFWGPEVQNGGVSSAGCPLQPVASLLLSGFQGGG